MASRSMTSSDICFDCLDLGLERSPSAVVTTINGIERRQATVTVGFGDVEPHTKNCGYCAMIRSALFACVAGYTGRGTAYLHLATITMVRNEPLLLTLEDWMATGADARFGVEIYRDPQFVIPELDWIGACSKPVQKSTSGTSWSNFAIECLKECDGSHNGCVKSVSKLPTRVLDLGEIRSSADLRLKANVRLVTNETIAANRYAALSHCWGPKGIDFKLKSTSLKAFYEGIAFVDLPPTHQDAIVATRQLGIRYLWIDSLCIVQDSDADLQKETAVMGDIYSNAYVTIAAVCSPSSHVSFQDTECRPFTSHKIRFRSRRMPGAFKAMVSSISPSARRKRAYLYACLTQRSAPPRDNSASSAGQEGISDAIGGPLSKRAWTLQERALSRRVIHFTSEGIQFECQSYLKTKDGLLSTPGYLSRWDFIETLRESNITAPERTRHELQKLWRRMLKDYTQRAITFRTDLMPPLSGLAARMQRMHRAEYLAGLWRDRLVEDMCWSLLTAKRLKHEPLPVHKEDAKVPTWSWISVQTPTSYPIIDEQGTFLSHCEVISATADIVGSQWNKFGHVRSGELVLRGPVRKAMLKMYSSDSNKVDFGQGADTQLEPDTTILCCDVQAGDTTEEYWRRALEGEEFVRGEAEVLCLRPGTWTPNYATTGLTSVGLTFVMVLGKSSEQPGAYQRLGLLERGYGGAKFDDVEGTVGLMRRTDELRAKLARMAGTEAPNNFADSDDDWLEEMKNKPAYPAAKIEEIRIV